MRTPSLLLALAVGLALAAPTAAASPDLVDSLLQRMGLGSDPSRADPQQVDPPVDIENPTVPTDRLLDTVSGALDAALAPATAAARTLGLLGLGLTANLFQGVEGGSELVASSMNAVAAHPLPSTIIATLSLAAVGAVSLLGLLVQRYGSVGAIPLYTRIARSELMENGVRQQIFELIRQNPGINVSEISRRLDIAWGTATHHLQKLRHEKLVGIRVASNQKCYFPNGGTYTPREMDVMSAVKHPTARQIAEFLIHHGPTNHGILSEALGLTPALVSFHTSKLVEHGVLAREKQGRHSLFTCLESTLDPAPRPATAH